LIFAQFFQAVGRLCLNLRHQSEGAKLKAREQLKVDIVGLLHEKKISVDDARQALNVSKRTIERYLSLYQSYGVMFARHGNAGRAPVNKTNHQVISNAQALMKNKYFDFNITHALDKLKVEDGIKINRETFRKSCHEIGMVKRATRRRGKVRRARERTAQNGVMLQMDGSPHRWFGDIESCLIGAIDDASSTVCEAEFFESETTLGCLKVLKNIIEKKGLFHILYTDRAGIFGGPKRNLFSQVKRALDELGIQIIFANSPQAKGRIERLWNTLQDRLIPEMRLRNIRSFETANHFLQNVYLPNDHNKRFAVVPTVLESAWRKVPASVNLDDIFCIKELRQVKADHTFSWNGKIYQITSDFKYSIMHQKIEIRTMLDGGWAVYFADRKIEVTQHFVRPKIAVAHAAAVLINEADAFKVRKDGHVEYKNGYYSVDEKYIGELVRVSEQDDTLLIYHNHDLIESHQKLLRGFSASTKPAHIGPWEKQLRPGSIYRRAASQIGPSCERMVFIILQRGQGVVDNRAIWAILALRKSYGQRALEDACAQAINISSCDYRGVSALLRLRYTKRKSG
jgi:transposase